MLFLTRTFCLSLDTSVLMASSDFGLNFTISVDKQFFRELRAQGGLAKNNKNIEQN